MLQLYTWVLAGACLDEDDETWKRVMSETTFRGLEIWDLGIMARVGVRKLGKEGAGLEQSRGMGARAQ